LIVTDVALAVFEPEAVAVELEDVNVVSKAIVFFSRFVCDGSHRHNGILAMRAEYGESGYTD